MNDYPIIAFPSGIRSEYQELLQNDPEFAKFVAYAKRQQELMRPFYEAETREDEERAERMKYIMEYFKNRGKQKEWLTEMKREREMNEQKTFNIGDRVRFIRDYDTECVCVDKGDCGTIESIDDNLGIGITLDNPEYIRIFDTDYIESITSTDPKTAFLSELKGLLEKYGYSISSGINFGESDTYKAFGGMGFISSDESRDIDYNPKYGCITPNNIMDYEKE